MAKKTKGKGKESNVANISGKARTKRSDSTPNYLLWTCAIGLVLALIHSAHLHALFENDRYFSHLSTLERELSFRTEMGLYYSYFKTVASAPTFLQGLEMVLQDNQTEYPSTINTLQRFNLYPEVIVGAMFRVWQTLLSLWGSSGVECYQISRGYGQPPVEACNGLGDKPYFYVSCVFALNGVMATAIFALGTYLSESFAGGVLSIFFFFYNHGEATRVMWTPPLRESWAMPFLMLQMLALTHCIRQRAPSLVHYGLLAAASLAFLLPWQFSQFVLVTQSFSLLILHSLRLLTARTVLGIYLSLVAALTGNIVLQFCNSLLLFSLLPSSLLSCLAVLSCQKLYDAVPWKTLRMVFEVGSAVLLMAAFKAALVFAFGGQDDAHIGAILLSKLTAYQDFHTQLYTCSPEFDLLPWDYPLQLTITLLLPVALWVMATVAMSLVRHVYLQPILKPPTTSDPQRKSSSMEPKPTLRESMELPGDPPPTVLAEQVYHVVQCLAFAVLAILIMRLKLFLTPQLCILVAFVARSKFHWKLSPRVLVGLLLVGGAVRGGYNLSQQHSIVGEFNDIPLSELVEWVNSSALDSENAVFAGAMPTMAALRLSTSRPVVNHPHYEDAALRERTLDIYSVYSRQPPSQIHNKLSRLMVTHVVVEEPWCNKRYRPGCSFAEVWDVEDPENQGNPQFCQLIHTTIPNGFQLVFSNSIYKVLQLL